MKKIVVQNIEGTGKKKSRAWRILAIWLLAVCTLCSSCTLFPTEKVEHKMPSLKKAEEQVFSYTSVVRRNLEEYSTISVKYLPVRKLSLSFAVDDIRIDEMCVHKGDCVKAGDLLGKLETKGSEEEIKACEKELELKRINLRHAEEDYELAREKQEILFEDNPEGLRESVEEMERTVGMEIRAMQDALTVLELKIELLKAEQEKCSLVAPMDGIVSYVRGYSEESRSDSQETSVILTDNSSSFFEAETEYWDKFPYGMETKIKVRNKEYRAVVSDPLSFGREVVPSAAGEHATVCFALLDDDMEFSENDYGSVQLLLNRKENVLCISENAVRKADDNDIVYYLSETGNKAYKTVMLGMHAQGYYEVIEGLEEGELVMIP